MGFEPRGIDAGPNSSQGGSGVLGFGDTHWTEYLYGDTTGLLLAGMPVYRSCVDAAEYNRILTQTALTPLTPTSGGIVYTGTNALTGSNLLCVGIYWPESGNVNATPAKSDVIRVVDRGIIPVLAVSKASGTAVLVGDWLLTDTTPGQYAVSGHNTPVVARTIGMALATGSAITSGASLISVPGSGTTVSLINAAIRLF